MADVCGVKKGTRRCELQSHHLGAHGEHLTGVWPNPSAPLVGEVVFEPGVVMCGSCEVVMRWHPDDVPDFPIKCENCNVVLTKRSFIAIAFGSE